MAVLPFEADLCRGVAPRLSAMFTLASFSSNATQMDFQFFDAAYCRAEWPSTVVAFTFAPSFSSMLTTFSRPADAARISGVMSVCASGQPFDCFTPGLVHVRISPAQRTERKVSTAIIIRVITRERRTGLNDADVMQLRDAFCVRSLYTYFLISFFFLYIKK